jgi:hypothetical protein
MGNDPSNLNRALYFNKNHDFKENHEKTVFLHSYLKIDLFGNFYFLNSFWSLKTELHGAYFLVF